MNFGMDDIIRQQYLVKRRKELAAKKPEREPDTSTVDDGFGLAMMLTRYCPFCGEVMGYEIATNVRVCTIHGRLILESYDVTSTHLRVRVDMTIQLRTDV